MDRLIHFAEMIYTQHTTELILGILGCIVVLMIINLAGVRRCRKQIIRLTEKSKDVMKIAMSQRATDSGRDREKYIRKEQCKKRTCCNKVRGRIIWQCHTGNVSVNDVINCILKKMMESQKSAQKCAIWYKNHLFSRKKWVKSAQKVKNRVDILKMGCYNACNVCVTIL